jgi:alpha-1,2-mannosyltransferase
VNLSRVLKSRVDGAALRNALDRFFHAPVLSQKGVLTVLLVLLTAVILVRAYAQSFEWDTDAPSFYTGAVGLRTGVNIYDPAAFDGLAASLFGRSVTVYPYIYFPVLAELLIPLTLAGYPAFSQIVLGLNFVLTLLCLWLILKAVRPADRDRPAVALFLFLSAAVSEPLKTTLHHGQVNLLVLALVVGSLLLLEKGREFWAVALLVLAVFFKFYPVLVFALFLVQKRFRALGYAALQAAVVVCVSAVLFGARPWLDFFASATGNFLYGAKASFFFDFNAQWWNNSLNGLFTQVLLIRGASRSLALPLVLAMCAVSLAVLWRPVKRIVADADPNVGVSLALLVSLAVSTISWNHHFVILFLPLAVLVNSLLVRRDYGRLLLVFAIAAVAWRHPMWGGLPFTQALLGATLALTVVFLAVAGRRGPEVREKGAAA